MAIVRIQLRRDTAADWTSANPVLAEGEMGIETDTDLFKIGDGSTAWTSLGYGGLQGIQGPQGDAATLDVGTTTTGAEGTNATVSNSGTTSEAIFDFTIPKGDTGDTGPEGPQGGFDSTQTIVDIPSNFSTWSITANEKGALHTNAAAVTITIDDVLGVGEQIDFLQLDADQITFVAGSGVTLNSKDGNLKTAAQYSPASVKCVASGVYVLVGDLGA